MAADAEAGRPPGVVQEERERSVASMLPSVPIMPVSATSNG